MKQKINSFFTIFIIFIIIILIFNSGKTISNTVIFSSKLFLKNIFPSLFPMFIISSILVNINFPVFLGNLFYRINKIFKAKKEASFVFFMSMITGFPSSAKYINELEKNNIFDTDDSQKVLLFTFFSNPLFIVNTVGITFLNNKRYGILILISHIISNIIIGLIFRNYKSNIDKNNELCLINNFKQLNIDINNTNIFKVLLVSIKDSLNTLINIYGIITTFLIIINIFNVNYYKLFSCFLIGIIEMTSGLKYLSLSNFSIKLKLYLSCFFVSFGGLSVHTQIFNVLENKKIKYLPFLIARIIHATVSVIILFLLLLI